MAARRIGLVDQCVTGLLPGWKADVVTGGEQVALVAETQGHRAFEHEHVLFFEHVVVRLVGLFAGREELHRDGICDPPPKALNT